MLSIRRIVWRMRKRKERFEFEEGRVVPFFSKASQTASHVNGAWTLPNFACDFYIAMDVICSTSSIFNLVAISIDRVKESN
uniref:G-protein coupled receptors family 1 profile domain-containing protein n=1 Tax=Anopheles quadriannulatus TaxID=34691 RepID=A0A182XFA7_ANOQN